MCGIFGAIKLDNNHLHYQPDSYIKKSVIFNLANRALERGRDASGYLTRSRSLLSVVKSWMTIDKVIKSAELNKDTDFIIGHSRLVTNGMTENQPIVRDEIYAVHNGIITNIDSAWEDLSSSRHLTIDSEIICAAAHEYFLVHKSLNGFYEYINLLCEGVLNVALYMPIASKIVLFSNNGSLYYTYSDGYLYFASEKFALTNSGFSNVHQILGLMEINISTGDDKVEVKDYEVERDNLIPLVNYKFTSENTSSQGKYLANSLLRCQRCILPETMPFISFDDRGVCNYCANYKKISDSLGREKFLEKLIEYGSNKPGFRCLMPFSGGRDSSYALHLLVNEVGIKPVTFTYDWGMVTDLGRRNISRMCSKLNVENIIVASDIYKNRQDVRKNLIAWLRNPDLGMLNILTAGEKHFFRFNEVVKKQLGLNVNIWGTSPLEVTHFKSGFLGIPPNFIKGNVYSSGMLNQLTYQFKRFKKMIDSPHYFNSSIFRNLQGEYFRSIASKNGYIHMFDYFKWEESEVNSALSCYNWETSPDTATTWRIGDASAAFYNYVYYHCAGFSEHDTFRSNQIREGLITRAEALNLVFEENKPRIPNIKWYLDVLSLNFDDVMSVVNDIEPVNIL